MDTNSEPVRIYLDYAAATPVSERAHEAYCEALPHFANPHALHSEGLAAAEIRDRARKSIASVLGVKSQEIVFTSGGTEANNLALAGYIHALTAQKIEVADCHVVVGAIEHPSVLEVLQPFVSRGLQVTHVTPTEHGDIRPEAVREALRENTVMVSIALANSEIGTIQPLHAIGNILAKHTPRVGTHTLEQTVFHTDASQGLYHSLVPQGLCVNMMTLDSSKMYGPRGVGALYVDRAITLEPVLRGGSQERELRPGTANVALMAGFATAVSECTAQREEEAARLHEIRTAFLTHLIEHLEGVVVNGTAKRQSPHIANISVKGVDAEYLMMYLDQRGIALSTKSACHERSDGSTSHVVAALGGEPWRATNTLRFSFGRDTTAKVMRDVAHRVVEAIKHCREIRG